MTRGRASSPATGRSCRREGSLESADERYLKFADDGYRGIWYYNQPSRDEFKYNPGGEMVMWLSRDQGATWIKLIQLTRGSKFNHTYARRPLHAHPEFYALWADGHARQPSESSLYFTDKEGTRVWRLPAKMAGEVARPEAAW